MSDNRADGPDSTKLSKDYLSLSPTDTDLRPNKVRFSICERPSPTGDDMRQPAEELLIRQLHDDDQSMYDDQSQEKPVRPKCIGGEQLETKALVTKDVPIEEKTAEKMSLKYELNDTEPSANKDVPKGKPAETNIDSNSEDRLLVNIGDVLDGRYTIESVLGEGGFGVVYKAFDKNRIEKVALKILKKNEKSYASGLWEVRILQVIGKKDPNFKSRCVRMLNWFEYQGHICIRFRLLALSLAHFKMENDFQPYDMDTIRVIAYQLCHAAKFLHANRIIHTDIKLDNVLFIDSSYVTEFDQQTQRYRRDPINGAVRLIDFGLATFDYDHHMPLIQTRPYRAPEVVLKMRWSTPCDVWSIGICILKMYLPGHSLLDADDNLQHLAMLEHMLGPIPDRLIREHKTDEKDAKYFRDNGLVNLSKASESYKNAIKNISPLPQCLARNDKEDRELLSFIKSLLKMDPRERLEMSEAKDHAFFKRLPPEIRRQF